MLGMLSPASRGALMTAGIFIFMFMGYVAMSALLLIYATADEADVYMFYKCYFAFCFLFFSVRHNDSA